MSKETAAVTDSEISEILCLQPAGHQYVRGSSVWQGRFRLSLLGRRKEIMGSSY